MDKTVMKRESASESSSAKNKTIAADQVTAVSSFYYQTVFCRTHEHKRALNPTRNNTRLFEDALSLPLSANCER